MKVSDLIELLKMEDQDAEVHFQYNYGDHWRTQVAPKVDSVHEGFVIDSDGVQAAGISNEPSGQGFQPRTALGRGVGA